MNLYKKLRENLEFKKYPGILYVNGLCNCRIKGIIGNYLKKIDPTNSRKQTIKKTRFDKTI